MIFYPYEFKARMIPSVIPLLPRLWTVYFLRPKVVSDPSLIRHLRRDRVGSALREPVLGKSGGVPSRMGRMRDSYLSIERKNRIHSAAGDQFSIELLSLIEELKNPELADRRMGMYFGK
jgi:hypothetical protein